MIRLHDESKPSKGDALTDACKLLRIVKATREYLDMLEAATHYGQRWEGYPEQTWFDRIGIRLTEICEDQSDLEIMMDRWDEQAYKERRDSESQACQIQTDGLATRRP